MADNVQIDESTAPSATKVAADEVTRNAVTEKQQVVKIGIGADGASDGLASKTTPLPTTPLPDSASTGAVSNSSSTGNETGRVIKASAGRLFGLTGYNAKASAQFILLYNSTTVPSDGAQAVVVIKVSAASSFSIDFGLFGRYFSTGIAVSNSSTQPTKTVGSADCHFDAQYL